MNGNYKFMPPPSNKNATVSRNSSYFNQSKRENTGILNETDENFLQILKSLDVFYQTSDIQNFLKQVDFLCHFLERKLLPKNLNHLFTNTFHTIQSISEALTEYRSNVADLDCIFHFLYILTSPTNHHQYFELVPLDTLISDDFFFDHDLTFKNSIWFFYLLSNFVNQHFSLNFSFELTNLIFIKIVNLQLNEEIIRPLHFLSNLTEYPITIENSVKILEILDYSGGVAHRKTGNCPIVHYMAQILLNLAKNRCLEIKCYLLHNFHTFVRQHFNMYVEFVKLVGYLYYHFWEYDNPDICVGNHQKNEIFSVNLCMLAAFCCIDGNSDYENENIEFSIWAMYNQIVRNSSEILAEEIKIAPLICEFLEKNFDKMSFSVKKNCILLVSLIYSKIPLSFFNDDFDDDGKTNYHTLLSFLHNFKSFLEDLDDDDFFLFDNVLNAMGNIYSYLSRYITCDANDQLIGAFEEIRILLISSNFSKKPEIYELLNRLVLCL